MKMSKLCLNQLNITDFLSSNGISKKINILNLHFIKQTPFSKILLFIYLNLIFYKEEKSPKGCMLPSKCYFYQIFIFKFINVFFPNKLSFP